MNRRAALHKLGRLSAGLCLLPACAKAPPTDSLQVRPVAPPPSTAAAGVSMVPPPGALRVDLTHDVICPWCRIGHHNLRVALRTWSGGPVTVRLHPYLLDPSVPPEGVDLRARLAERYGAAQLESMFARVTQAGASYGITFDFQKIRRTPDTTISHALVLGAPADKQSDLLDLIHRDYFEQGADIGTAAVLLRAWQEAGLPRAQAETVLADAGAREQVRQAAEAASAKGLHGVPHFEIHGPGGDVVLHGGQAPEAIGAALRQAAG